MTRPMSTDQAESIALQALAFARCAATTDFVEGINAFAERRAPVFRGG